MASAALIDYIKAHQYVLIQTDFWREIFMIADRMVAQTRNGDQFTITTQSPLYKGKLFAFEGRFFGTESFTRIDDRSSEDKIYQVKGTPTEIVHVFKETVPLCTPQDKMLVQPGDIANYPEGSTLDSTIGIFLANYVFLVYPFGDIIPYVNEEFSESKLQDRISRPLLDGVITTKDTKDKYINALSLFGQSNEIFCPGISEKTISIPDSITQLRERLIAENKEALEAGDASVMSDIEQQLIQAYKDHLKGDSSLHFLLKKKYFNVAMKKLFLTQGMVEQFGSPGKFSYVAQPMGSGWKQEDLPTIFNEVRQGSYARAVETADGGVIAKLILRVFQDTRIVIDDCGTKRGEQVNGDKSQLKEFVWNYVVEKDGTNTLLTPEDLDKFVNKDLTIRTPGYCQAEEGFCAKCFGKPFEVLGQKAFAPVANDFAKVQTTNALKSMHGKSHSTVDISNINDFLLV